MESDLKECSTTNVAVHDHLVYIIICIEDDTILVNEKKDVGSIKHSLVSISLNENESWREAGKRLARKV